MKIRLRWPGLIKAAGLMYDISIMLGNMWANYRNHDCMHLWSYQNHFVYKSEVSYVNENDCPISAFGEVLPTIIVNNAMLLIDRK